ncbi:protein spalt-accessory-like [Drosophila kikkawai]|uniref:Protein spalt-accessory-like n=1 Tax=Drosophila kikkawai TaxID=30033 RepID=A0A6P4IL94_DROKI|nr:translation initiation factor IF-2-like [Drosophila kikkawai]
MAFRYIFVISAVVVLAQGSYLSSVDQESEVGVHSSGGVSSGAGIPRGYPAAPQPQRPVSGHGGSYGPAGGSQQRPRPHGGSPRRQTGGYNRPAAASHVSGGVHGGRPIGGGSGHGNPHQNRNRNPKPY